MTRRALAVVVVLAFIGADVRAAEPRGYAGALDVPAVGDTPEPTPQTSAPPPADVQVAAASTDAEAPPSPPPPRLVTRDHPSGLSGPRLAMQRAGVVAIVLGAAGWVATIAGLGIGSAADSDIAPLRGRDEIDERRDLVARGRLANRLALGAGISAGVMLAIGVTLLAVARRRPKPGGGGAMSRR